MTLSMSYQHHVFTLEFFKILQLSFIIICQFTTTDALIKLKRLYQKLQVLHGASHDSIIYKKLIKYTWAERIKALVKTD